MTTTASFRRVDIDTAVDWSKYASWTMAELFDEHNRRGLLRRMGDGRVLLSKRLATDDLTKADSR